MKSSSELKLNWPMQFKTLLMALSVGFMVRLALNTAYSAAVVTNCTEADLRAAMAGGGRVTFACDGTITLGATIFVTTNTSLNAAGRQITISGSNAVRVFYVNSNVTFTLLNLTVANGRVASDWPGGAGVRNLGGVVNATNCVFRGNHADYALNTNLIWLHGGAIYNQAGQVNFESCTFADNRVSGPGTPAYFWWGGTGWGGAVDNAGILNADLCHFISNSVVGATGLDRGFVLGWEEGGHGGNSSGGAIYDSGTMGISRCTFSGNCAAGGAGGQGSTAIPENVGFPGGQGGFGGEAKGGAIHNDGVARVINSTFALNRAIGGDGGRGGNGGMAYMVANPCGGGGWGGIGGDGYGAAAFNGGTTCVINTTFAHNSAAGGTGGSGGTGASTSNPFQIPGNGGYGGSGGSAYSGVFDTNGLCWITNCTLALNSGTIGLGGAGGAGGFGSIPGTPGLPGAPGTAVGGIKTAGSTLVNTLLGTNPPANGFGWISDAGHNLSSDATSGFTNVSSLNNTDPKLAPLTNNGGLTLTMALLPGSPAIDAGDDSAAPPIDQRGFPRPAGTATDIGAFEYGSMLPILTIRRSSPGLLNVLVQGNANRFCRLLTATNLSDWYLFAPTQIGADGTVTIEVGCDPGETSRYYRVVMP